MNDAHDKLWSIVSPNVPNNTHAAYGALNMAVSASLWSRVRNGAPDAIEELRAKAQGLVLYDHILSVGGDDVWVSLDELYKNGIISAIRLYNEIPAD